MEWILLYRVGEEKIKEQSKLNSLEIAKLLHKMHIYDLDVNKFIKYFENINMDDVTQWKISNANYWGEIVYIIQLKGSKKEFLQVIEIYDKIGVLIKPEYKRQLKWESSNLN